MDPNIPTTRGRKAGTTVHRRSYRRRNAGAIDTGPTQTKGAGLVPLFVPTAYLPQIMAVVAKELG